MYVGKYRKNRANIILLRDKWSTLVRRIDLGTCPMIKIRQKAPVDVVYNLASMRLLASNRQPAVSETDLESAAHLAHDEEPPDNWRVC